MENLKLCATCGVLKDRTSDFPKNGRIYRANCKECHSNKQKERYKVKKDVINESRREKYDQNRSDILEKNRESYAKHNEKRKEYRNEYYRDNRNEILAHTKTTDYKEKRNKYLRDRRKNDKKFALVNSYRTRLNEVLQKQKQNTYIHLLGCKREEFLDWIEYQFNEVWKWETYARDWVVDHVIPIDFFDLDNDIHRFMCFSWFNLRPFCKKENSVKSNKIELETVKKHQELIDVFIKNKHIQINNRYQADIEIYQWLRRELRYGKNPVRLDNPQPNS
jgi:hypothetical protein